MFKIGDKVFIKNELYAGATIKYYNNTIVAFDTSGNPLVKVNSYPNVIRMIAATQLLSEVEALVEISRLNDEQSKLDAEFDKVKGQISLKMKVAADAINEASDLAKLHNKELYSLYDETRTLVSALEHNGWRTSSMNC